MSMKTFPTLYTKTSTGAINQWEIWVASSVSQELQATVWTRYGQVGGKLMETNDTIKEGKNVGKANATTPYEQAVKEAQAKWTKQKKGGYVETPEAAQAGEVDALITGGIDPMLAHYYMEVITDDRTGEVTYILDADAKKIKWPAYVQPKLDGIRCAGEDNGGMWTRSRKPITSCPHLSDSIKELSAIMPKGIFLDGELYNHALKADFEEIASAVRKGIATEKSSKMEYHLYDLVSPGTFEERSQALAALLDGYDGPVKLVKTIKVNSHEELVTAYEAFRAEGYEGLMVRNAGALYQNKKCTDLLKVKPFNDDEFVIVGFTEGSGKLQGHLGTWICRTKEGAEFETAMNGPQPKLKEYFENGQSYIGKLLTIRFQGYTGANKVPRIPKGHADGIHGGHAVRDYE